LRVRAALAAVLLALAGCGEFPKDSNETLNEVRAGRPLRVGWSAAEPWVREGQAEPTGLEAELVRQFAQSIGAKIEWVPAGEAQLVEALAENAVDLGIAGFAVDAPWGARIGQTQNYLTTTAVIGAAEGTTLPESWDGVPVRYDRRRPQFDALLRGIGAEPVPVEPGGDLKPIGAAYAQELGPHGLFPTGETLLTEDRVIATPPAENALAIALDRFLHSREGWIAERVAAEARR
jgi:ABC-type amino acid transport substrate-binding protein